MKKILIAATLASIGAMTGIVSAATPSGFTNTTLTVNAQVNAACQEAQHGSFPNPLIVDTQSAVDQTFSPSADETVKCTNGTVFTIKVSSGNGTAVNQTCTSSGVSNMALKSAGSPADAIAYMFLCSGDTDGSGHFKGAGTNTARGLGMSVKILAANAQAAVAHADYADTVTLTIAY
jgi:spore coat protein U-like protein